jgi:hypothetical protein
MCSYAELFCANVRREQPWRWWYWEVGAPGFLAPPALGHAFLPRLRVSARTGLFLYVKRLTARRFVK